MPVSDMSRWLKLRYGWPLGVVVLGVLLALQTAVADTVTLTPVMDNTMYEPEAETSNGSGVYLFAGNTDGVGVRRALLAFDIAGSVPPGSAITSASLTLSISRSAPGSGDQPHTLHRVLQEWGEGASDAGDPGGEGTSAENDDATWVYRIYNKDNPGSSLSWTTVGGDYVSTASATQDVGKNGTVTWSSAQMATDVQGWLDSPSTDFGWLMKGNEGGLKNAKRFDSRESSTAANRPELVIVYGEVSTPPDVTTISPNGGETVVANASSSIDWSASDESGISTIDLYQSDDNGASYRPIALGLPNTPPYTWFAANRPTSQALIRIVATDNTLVTAQDESDAVFTINSPVGGIVPTTLRDFDQPGSQPFDAGTMLDPTVCEACHGNYGEPDVEPHFNWEGSMMAQASRDLLFEAAMVIANQDAPDSGDLCLRCHFNRGWLEGRSIPTDGSQMVPTDSVGLSCDFCHRLVDPIPDAENPAEDADILAALADVPTEFGTGMFVIDPNETRRGPFVDADTGHPILVSPFHQEAALCGTCHDVSNPAFEKDGGGGYVPNAFDSPATDFSPTVIAPVERTYSEWLNSEYNTPTGVYAPEFGGNQDYVGSCQDCHMRDVTGRGCDDLAAPIREDLPLHDMTGGSTWLPGLLSTQYPGEVDDAALQAGITRARYMLQNAAELEVVQEGADLKVTITNNTGHKLPSGYPEGRRIWINVEFLNDVPAVIEESGAYDLTTGVLTHDAEVKIYEIEPSTLGVPGVADGTLFHFVLNNDVLKDNRIPPRGFTNAAYADFGGAPVAYSYADGQYWDESFYTIPLGTTSAEVTLYYQSTSKEFVEFLRDENTTNTKGQEMYDLWNDNGKSPPEVMASTIIAVPEPAELLLLGSGLAFLLALGRRRIRS